MVRAEFEFTRSCYSVPFLEGYVVVCKVLMFIVLSQTSEITLAGLVVNTLASHQYGKALIPCIGKWNDVWWVFSSCSGFCLQKDHKNKLICAIVEDLWWIFMIIILCYNINKQNCISKDGCCKSLFHFYMYQYHFCTV